MLGHAKDSLWSVDLFRCESILLNSHWVMLVMDLYTRRIIGFAVHAGNVDGSILCRMFNDASSSQSWPLRISSDNDPLFQYNRWRANLRILEIEEIKSLPHSPMSHPFVERLMGSIRRELLDQTIFWVATGLANKLREYQRYYKELRTHTGRDGDTPVESRGDRVIALDSYRWEKHCRGLFQLPVAT
jgi:putative transposase